LDLQSENIGSQDVDRRVAEQRKRRLLELNGDLGRPPSQSLAGAQIKGDAGPTPIVDRELHRNISLGIAVRGHPWLLPIRGHGVTVDNSGTILPAHDVPAHLRVIERVDRLEHLVFLGAYSVGREGVWRPHRDQAEKLKDMVRHHVAQRTRRFVEPRAPLDTDGFGD